jgi:hypothetical protein
MSKRRQHDAAAAAAAADPIVIHDSDSQSDTEYSANPGRRPIEVAASSKKARGPDDPKNSDEAQEHLDATAASALLCNACLCRDRAHMAVDRFVHILTLVPVSDVCHADGAVKIIEPRSESEDYYDSDPAYAVALSVIGDCRQIDKTFECAPPGCYSHIRPESKFGRIATRCCDSLHDRRKAFNTVPELALGAINTALQLMPQVLVDIVASYLNIADEYVNLPFVRGVYDMYTSAILRFVLRMQSELHLIEMPSSALRSMFDGDRKAAAYNVLAVIDGVRVLAENHACGAHFSEIANTLRDNVHGMISADNCNHTVIQAKRTRVAMLRRSDAVLAEEKRLRELGFSVALQLF